MILKLIIRFLPLTILAVWLMSAHGQPEGLVLSFCGLMLFIGIALYAIVLIIEPHQISD